MAYVIQVNFDSHWKLSKPFWVFKFRGREFKLLRGRARGRSKLSEKDCVLSLLSRDHNSEWERVHRDIMIFCGCLAFENDTPIIVSGGGGYGNSLKMTTRQLRRSDVTQREMPTNMHFLSIERIPYVHNRDQEDAIGLYREGLVSNSPFYRFLCFWNILNIPLRNNQKIKDWINKTKKHKKQKIRQTRFLEDLKGKTKNVGDYLENECRDAIAHIRRFPAKGRNIDPNNGNDYRQMWSACYFLQDLVKIYMSEDLEINQIQYLWPNHSRRGVIPEYLTEKNIESKILNG